MSTALTAICKLVSGETISAVLPQVTELLSHPTDLVRKKAVMVLHRFYQRSPSAVAHLLPRFRTALCDKARLRGRLGLCVASRPSQRAHAPPGAREQDPSVMGASLCALYDLAAQDPAPYRNLVPSFVSILKQARAPRSAARPGCAA